MMKDFFRRLTIAQKITVGSLIGIILLAVILAFLSFRGAKENLEKEAFQRLTVIRESKAQHLEDYFSNLKNLLLTTADNSLTKEAIRDLSTSFYLLSEELNFDINQVKQALIREYRQNYLSKVNYDIPGVRPPKNVGFYLPRDVNGMIAQYIFIVENPYPIGKKNLLVYNPKYSCSYMEYHKRFHPNFNNLLEKFGLYDIFLIDSNGTVVYTTFKEKDFATNLIKGPYKDTGLAKAYKKALSSPKDTVVFSDFSPYEPSYNLPAAFVATPIYERGKVLGVLVFQIPIDKIDAIVNFNYQFKSVGLGKTGEVFLVGSDYYLRNNIRFLDKIDNPLVKKLGTTIGILRYKSPIVDKALLGEKGTAFVKDFFNEKALASYTPVNVFGGKWALISEIEEKEILSGLTSLSQNRNLLYSIVLLITFIGIFLLFVRTNIVNPLNKLIETSRDLSEGEGDLTKKLEINSGDEIGIAAKYLNAFIDKVRNIIEIAKTSAKQNLKTATELKNKAEEVKNRIENEKEAIMETASVTNKIKEPLDSFKDLLSESSEKIGKVSEKLKLALESLERLHTSVVQTEEQNIQSITRLKELNSETENIKRIIEIIQGIADKTNLLALNASIEAARAGESGKGFAVVADEIRKLAEQIQKNTSSINTILNSIANAIMTTTENIENSSRKNVSFLKETHEMLSENMNEVKDIMEDTKTTSISLNETANMLIESIETLIRNIECIEKISEQNYESVSDIIQKIKEIYRETEELNEILKVFKTNGD